MPDTTEPVTVIVDRPTPGMYKEPDTLRIGRFGSKYPSDYYPIAVELEI